MRRKETWAERHGWRGGRDWAALAAMLSVFALYLLELWAIVNIRR